MSDSYVGSSGSSYGASSSGGASGNALTQSILGAVSLAGENIALASQPAQVVTPVRSAPLTSSSGVVAGLSGGSSTWIIVLFIIVIGFFAYKEL